uniref:rho-related GTP-binding protein RhoF n=1 Tax=Myxine glutinosa TaxID=7769 RepID=UPI00358EF138
MLANNLVGQQQDSANSEQVKLVIVGDGACGKTSLITVFAKGTFPEDYTPSVFEKYERELNIGRKRVSMSLWDTAGQEDYDRLRPLAYNATDVVLMCYDVTDYDSYDNVFCKWSPEVSHFCRGTPILLIGCKTDLRMDKIHLRRLKEQGKDPLTYYKGEQAAQKIQAHIYLECSAKFHENIEDIFREAAKLGLRARRRPFRQRTCTLL